MLEFEFSSPMRDPYLGQTEYRHKIIKNIYSEPSTEGGYSRQQTRNFLWEKKIGEKFPFVPGDGM